MMLPDAASKTILLVTSWASLLSGPPNDCHSPTDETCYGGVAAVRALLRYNNNSTNFSNITNITNSLAPGGDILSKNNAGNPALLMQLLDKDSSFVHMHPLGLAVNRLILNNLMGLEVFISSPSILLQNEVDFDVSTQDISGLQTHDMPLLLTNVGVPPANSWHPYVRAVHLDASTGLATMSISKSDETLNVPQIEATVGMLRHVSRLNEESGCKPVSGQWGFFVKNETSTGFDEEPQCWVPVVYHLDVENMFAAFVEGMLQLDPELRPALIIDTAGHDERYQTPTLVDGIWIGSHRFGRNSYFEHKITISITSDGPVIDNVEYLSLPLHPLPEDAKDEIYSSEIMALRSEADEALHNNPVIGYSNFMPVTRDSSTFRRCKAGECPLGNLFTDAARWYADADVSFITSGGVRGPGWPEGQVSVSDVWDALPFPNTLCTGEMMGIHLFQLLNYSMAVATFEGEETDDGGRLLQVSGMKVVYNTQLEGSRLVSVDVWDNDVERYLPIERLRVYKFATDSYLCGAYRPFPTFLVDDLTLDGEIPGKIGRELYQEILADYMNAATNEASPYNTTTQGRLLNDTIAFDILNLIEAEDGCEPGTFWKQSLASCLSCPLKFDVTFSRQNIELTGLSYASELIQNSVLLKNNEMFSVAVIPKSAPSWLQFGSPSSSFKGMESLTTLGPEESLELIMIADTSASDPGTAYVTIAFGVLDGGEYPGCVGQDATFGITMRVIPPEEKNHLGNIKSGAFALLLTTTLTSISFAVWVFWNRKQQIVRFLQPIFLVTICVGVLIMGLTIIPISIDDAVASQRGCNIACMAIPWLLSIGFTVAMSALFAKLWRINRLFGQQLRKVQVRAQDVLAPLVVLFFLNFVLLLTWTLVDPLTWERFPIDGASWNTYGICVGSNKSKRNTFVALSAALNIGALLLATGQAWKARNISDQFSEAKSVGIALYSWVQLLIVGVPVLFMIDEDNITARYFLLVALVFAVCMSMLLIIFIPLFIQIRKARLQQTMVAHRTQPTLHVMRPSNVRGRSKKLSGTSLGDGVQLGQGNYEEDQRHQIKSSAHSLMKAPSDSDTDYPKEKTVSFKEDYETDLMQTSKSVSTIIDAPKQREAPIAEK